MSNCYKWLFFLIFRLTLYTKLTSKVGDKILSFLFLHKKFELIFFLVNGNIDVIKKRQMDNAFILASLSTKCYEKGSFFLRLSLCINPFLIFSRRFSIAYNKHNVRSLLYLELRELRDSYYLGDDALYACLGFFLYHKLPDNKFLNSIMKSNDVFLMSIFGQSEMMSDANYKDVCNSDKKNVNALFSYLIDVGDIKKCEYILSRCPSKITNKNLNDFYFSQGDFLSGYISMKKRDMSNIFKKLFPNKYIQSKSELFGKVLVLNSWGVGDDIRYSSLYDELLSIHPNVEVSCDTRLIPLFNILYPAIKFIGSARTKCVTAWNYNHYSSVPLHTHHVLCNDLFRLFNDFDRVTFITDLIPDLYLNSQGNNTSLEFKRRREKYIGLCWTSSIKSDLRSKHYFSIDDLLPILELEMEGYQFVSLQYDLDEKDIEAINLKYGINIISPDIDQYNDFLSLYSYIKNLDCVISAGTVVLELSGLANVPTYALTNSKSQKYRVSNNIDKWFKSITYADDFDTLTDEQLIEAIKNKIFSLNI